VAHHRRHDELIAADQVFQFSQAALPILFAYIGGGVPKIVHDYGAREVTWQSSRSCARVRCTRWLPRSPTTSPVQPGTRSSSASARWGGANGGWGRARQRRG